MLHQRRLLGQYDPTLLIVVLLLLSIGLLMIYSSTRSSLLGDGKSPYSKVRMQFLWLLFGLLAMIAVAMLDYEKLAAIWLPILGSVVVLLLLVLAIGKLFPDAANVRGTVRWLEFGPVKLQPSELAKIAVVISLAMFIVMREDEIDTFGLVTRSLMLVMVPLGLIFLQPDLGTPVVLICIWLTVLFVAGARLKHLAIFVMAGMLLIVIAWNTGIIRENQKDRILSFLAPEKDPQGTGWQLRQSMIAIGAGGPFGQGLFKGKQTQLSFVPDQETDFIFTAIGEELGFAGALLTITLFAILLYRALRISATARDTLGRLMAAGICAIFLVHFAVNIGMTIGLAPVKGMPLPFVSYGGSNLLTSLILIGLLESIYMRRHKIIF